MKQIDVVKATIKIVIAVSLTGCAMTNAVQKMGPDTFTVTAIASPIRGGSGAAAGMALEDANKHCASMGREILVTNTTSQNLNAAGAGSATVNFRCLEKGDYELTRPNYRPAPTIVIEDGRK